MKKDILRVFSTNLIKMFVSLISAFFIPAILSVTEYGNYKLYVLYASYVGISHFGFCDGVFLKYGGKNLERLNRNEFATEHKSILYYEMGLTVAFLALGIIRGDMFTVLLGLSFLPMTMITYYTYMYQAAGEFLYYSRVYRGMSILSLTVHFILVFVLQSTQSILYIFGEIFVKYVIFVVTAISFAKKYNIREGSFSFKVLGHYMKTGILLTIGNLAYVLFTSIDKWFVKGLIGLEAFASYSFAVQLLSLINMFITPIALTFYSHMSRRKDKAFEYKIKSILTVIFMFMLCIVFILKYIIGTWLEKYTGTINIIIVLFLAQVFVSLNTALYVNLFKVYKVQKRYFLNLMLAIVVSAALNIMFFWAFNNSLGIALATLVSMIIWSILNLNSFKYLKLKTNHVLFLIFCIVSYCGCNMIESELIGLIVYIVLFLVALVTFARDIFAYGIMSLKKSVQQLKHI